MASNYRLWPFLLATHKSSVYVIFMHNCNSFTCQNKYGQTKASAKDPRPLLKSSQRGASIDAVLRFVETFFHSYWRRICQKWWYKTKHSINGCNLLRAFQWWSLIWRSPLGLLASQILCASALWSQSSCTSLFISSPTNHETTARLSTKQQLGEWIVSQTNRCMLFLKRQTKTTFGFSSSAGYIK